MANDMLFGALVVVLGAGISLYEFFHKEAFEMPLRTAPETVVRP
jgi:hypothetical protein